MLGLLSCSSSQELVGPDGTPVPERRASATRMLSAGEASFRAALVSQVRYELDFDFSSPDPAFTGKLGLTFDLSKAPGAKPLTLDFSGSEVSKLTVNDTEISENGFNGKFVVLPSKHLRLGTNRVTMSFKAPYSITGDGFYRFTDPVDQRVYAYSNFEPYAANLMFPGFDQPDLKGVFRTRVIAPKDWLVTHTTLEESVRFSGPNTQLWTFGETLPMSTYVFSITGGPFEVWKKTMKTASGPMPMRLLARKSLAKFVHFEEWLRITELGIRYFEKYFDYPYPYRKYDQILVPDFNPGAMENVANVTFTEYFVNRGKESASQREKLADVILHEMAHMWFGNLVTMRWWDDLWLNESFATYMASKALVEAKTPFRDAWTAFAGSKLGSYMEDELVTTHPISTAVPDTEVAFTNFDAITYGKGASVMKQLAFYLGENEFRDGMRKYFKQFAYSNTRAVDFMNSMEAASGKDLSKWSDRWIHTAGLNSVETKLECLNGKITQLELRQKSPNTEVPLRTHKLIVGLLSVGKDGKLRAVTKLPALLEESANVKEAIGLACPALVFPNYEDHAYVKVRLGEHDIATLQKSLSQVSDATTRSQLWAILWQMTWNAELDVNTYADIVLAHAPHETDLRNSERAIQNLYGRRTYATSVLSYLPPGAKREAMGQRMEAAFEREWKRARPGSDTERMWLDAFLRAARTPAALESLAAALENPKGSNPRGRLARLLDQDRRWVAMFTLSRRGHPRAGALRAAELKRDSSQDGKMEATSSEAANPQPENKAAFFKKLTEPNSLTITEAGAITGGLFPAEDKALQEPYAEAYFAALPNIYKERSPEYARLYMAHLMPVLCTPENETRLKKFSGNTKIKNPALQRELLEAIETEQRCLRIRKRLSA